MTEDEGKIKRDEVKNFLKRRGHDPNLNAQHGPYTATYDCDRFPWMNGGKKRKFKWARLVYVRAGFFVVLRRLSHIPWNPTKLLKNGLFIPYPSRPHKKAWASHLEGSRLTFGYTLAFFVEIRIYDEVHLEWHHNRAEWTDKNLTWTQ